ncbi:MAG: diadenylate cyclase CdaA [Bacteroidales bacterium]|nr:diadenylate cyclase CdaA [Bacteroidales bacterium]
MIHDILGILHISFVDILDILVVALIIYTMFKWLRGSSAMNIFLAIILLLVIRVVAVALNMKMLSALLGTVIDVGAVALVVIFQPEIRQFLSRFGRTAGLKRSRNILDKLLGRRNDVLEDNAIEELTDACSEMSEEKTGALIVIVNKDPLTDVAETGDRIDADIRKRLIENIFFKNSPLHDGAMLIGGGRIVAARCTLPITDRNDIPAHYGMRHKAAIGLTERCDASVIVVSEQTGKISVVRFGEIRTVGRNDLKLFLSGEGKDK